MEWPKIEVFELAHTESLCLEIGGYIGPIVLRAPLARLFAAAPKMYELLQDAAHERFKDGDCANSCAACRWSKLKAEIDSTKEARP